MRHYSRVKSAKDVLIGVVLVGTAFMSGCNADLLGVSSFETGLDKISLYGPSTVQVGDTVRLSASGSVTGIIGYLLIDRIPDGKFAVSDPTIAAILPFNPPPGDTTSFASVRVEGLKIGRVEVTVRARGKSATHSVEVTPATP